MFICPRCGWRQYNTTPKPTTYPKHVYGTTPAKTERRPVRFLVVDEDGERQRIIHNKDGRYSSAYDIEADYDGTITVIRTFYY